MGDNQILDSWITISQLLLDPQKSMTYLTTLEFHEDVISWLI